jgi:glutamate synthase (NADPH) small chain
MGDPKGFLKVKRAKPEYRPVCERINDYERVFVLRPEDKAQEQASRCMDCGTPFCHSACPVGNYIPEWNDLMFRGHWQRALELLLASNNLPEVTGRVCPAPCEFACVLGINDDPVTVRENELSIIERGYAQGMIKAQPPVKRTGKKVAVIGSGPAGLSCAQQLNRAGHSVTVFEKDGKAGGILRYGIPDFKLEKAVLDRKIAIMMKEGVEFKTATEAGAQFPAEKLRNDFDAVCLCGGARQPRDLAIEGRELAGIYFAMDFLSQANQKAAGEAVRLAAPIDAKGRSVLVIGGGDTGSDCVGTAVRQGAACVVQIEVLPKPPECRTAEMAWPKYPLLLKTTTSHEEGGERHWSVLTKKFTGAKGAVRGVSCVKVEFVKDAKGCPAMKELPGSGFEIETDLVILAVGFLQPVHAGLLDGLGVAFDQRGNVRTDGAYMSSVKGVFSAGDMRRGQSLIVWAVSEGRRAAYNIDKYLMGNSNLPEM